MIPDERAIARGRRRLVEMLPWARAQARKDTGRLFAGNAIGRGTFGNIKAENLDAFMVYRAPLGGWHGDILLRDMPPGCPNVVGTPVGQPSATEAEAEAHAKYILVGLLKHIATLDPGAGQAPPGFLFFGFDVVLNPRLFTRALAAMPQFEDGYGSHEAAIERLDEIVSRIWPGGYHGEDPNELPRDQGVKLLTVIHIAALSGLFAYPPRRHGRPGDGRTGGDGMGVRPGGP